MKKTIVIEFDDAEDANDVIKSISKFQEMTWNNDTRKAMIKVDTVKRTVLVSKSFQLVPQPIRLR